MEVYRALSAMMFSWVMLREVISQIVFSFLPIDMELSLLDAIADPVEAHVH